MIIYTFFKENIVFYLFFYTLTPTEPHQPSPNDNFLYFFVASGIYIMYKKPLFNPKSRIFLSMLFSKIFFLVLPLIISLLIHCMLFFLLMVRRNSPISLFCMWLSCFSGTLLPPLSFLGTFVKINENKYEDLFLDSQF